MTRVRRRDGAGYMRAICGLYTGYTRRREWRWPALIPAAHFGGIV